MKKIFFTTIIFLLYNLAYSQNWEPNQAIQSLLSGVENAQKKGIISPKYGLDMVLGTYLNSNEKSLLTMYLESGQYYYFIAGGDDNVLDVDIVISDDSYNNVARDIERNKYAMVEYSPRKSGTYNIEVVMSSTVTDKPQFAVLTVMEYGLSYVKRDITESLKNLEKNWNKNEYKERGANFASDPEPVKGSYVGGYYSFCMFGKYITYEMNDGFTGNGISEGKDYMMFAAGDDDVKNLQLSITTSENRTSKDKGKAPYIAFNSGNSLTYDFSVTNLSHKGKSFIFCCMVRLK